MTRKPLVTNAGDPRQVRRAGQAERLRRTDELNDLREVLSNVAGRRFIWRLMERCKTFESVWHPSALVHYQAGEQDVGHWLMAEINETSRKLFFQMIQEHWPEGDENARDDD